MILCAFDLETTGLDVLMDRPIEVGTILYSTGMKKCLESSGYLVKTDVPISPEITALTGIYPSAVKQFGYESDYALDLLLEAIGLADAVIGHNVIQFDKRVLENWAIRHKRRIPEKLWIDTRTDLKGEGKHLGYQAADKGFLNLFPHSALSDCQTVLKLLDGENIDDVVARAKQPNVVVQSLQDREHNADAKKFKFFWKPDFKMWLKVVKESDIEALSKSTPFDITIVKELTPQQVWY